MIDVGDVVVAVKNGGQDRHGRPRRVPVVGKHYRITDIYPMAYGLGCTLKGLNPKPYQGFFLYVARRPKGLGHVELGWYFVKLEKGDTSIMDMIRNQRVLEDVT